MQKTNFVMPLFSHILITVVHHGIHYYVKHLKKGFTLRKSNVYGTV